MESNILRNCYNVRLLGQWSLVDMHREASLVSLEQRRTVQLLGLMYVHKGFSNVERVFARNTRQGHRYNFRTENDQSSKYKSSPYFKGSTMWDKLPLDVIRAPTLCEFRIKKRRIFTPFNEKLS